MFNQIFIKTYGVVCVSLLFATLPKTVYSEQTDNPLGALFGKGKQILSASAEKLKFEAAKSLLCAGNPQATDQDKQKVFNELNSLAEQMAKDAKNKPESSDSKETKEDVSQLLKLLTKFVESKENNRGFFTAGDIVPLAHSLINKDTLPSFSFKVGDPEHRNENRRRPRLFERRQEANPVIEAATIETLRRSFINVVGWQIRNALEPVGVPFPKEEECTRTFFPGNRLPVNLNVYEMPLDRSISKDLDEKTLKAVRNLVMKGIQGAASGSQPANPQLSELAGRLKLPDGIPVSALQTLSAIAEAPLANFGKLKELKLSVCFDDFSKTKPNIIVSRPPKSEVGYQDRYSSPAETTGTTESTH